MTAPSRATVEFTPTGAALEVFWEDAPRQDVLASWDALANRVAHHLPTDPGWSLYASGLIALARSSSPHVGAITVPDGWNARLTVNCPQADRAEARKILEHAARCL